MVKNLLSIYPYYIFLAIFIIIFALILFLSTKKYNKKRVNLYSLFLNLNIKSIILMASNILNFTFILYYSFNIDKFNSLTFYLILINLIISISISLNVHIIIFDIIYGVITMLSLKLLSLVNIYLNEIYYDKTVIVLGIIFMVMVLIYGLFITIRKLELILRICKNRRIINAK